MFNSSSSKNDYLYCPSCFSLLQCFRWKLVIWIVVKIYGYRLCFIHYFQILWTCCTLQQDIYSIFQLDNENNYINNLYLTEYDYYIHDQSNLLMKCDHIVTKIKRRGIWCKQYQIHLCPRKYIMPSYMLWGNFLQTFL